MLRVAGSLVVFAVASAACGADQTPPLQAPPPPTAEPVAPPPRPSASSAHAPPPPRPSAAELLPKTMQSQSDAFTAHDADKFASFFSSDATAAFYGVPELHGRAEIAATMRAVFGAVPDVKMAPVRVFQKGNVGIVEVVVAGTMGGVVLGMKPTKRPIGDRRLIVAWINDEGLLTQWHEYGDTLGLIAQMKGATDAPSVVPLPSTLPEAHIAKNTPDEDRLAAWVTAQTDASNRDGVKALAATMGPESDVTFYFLGAKTLKGKELERFCVDFFRAVPNAKFGVVNAWGIDGFVVDERTVHGTQRGRLGALAPSNNEFTTHFGEVWELAADAKLAHGWAYGNLGEVGVQTGAMKLPGGAPPVAAAAQTEDKK